MRCIQRLRLYLTGDTVCCGYKMSGSTMRNNNNNNLYLRLVHMIIGTIYRFAPGCHGDSILPLSTYDIYDHISLLQCNTNDSYKCFSLFLFNTYDIYMSFSLLLPYSTNYI
jgi:hypothetical protein